MQLVDRFLQDPPSKMWRVFTTFFVLAAHTGLFRALSMKLRIRDAIIAAGVSGAGGCVVGALCVYGWGPDRWYLTCAVCGLAGWAGGNVVLDKLTFVAWTILRGYCSPKSPVPLDVAPSEPMKSPTAKAPGVETPYSYELHLPPLEPLGGKESL